MLRFKEGVQVKGIQPEAVLAIVVAEKIFSQYTDTVVTSVMDGDHKPKSGKPSLHYKGLAVDFRTRHVSIVARKLIADKLRDVLPDEYDVVLEKTHLHCEFDPK